MGRGTSISLTKQAQRLGGLKNVRQCRPLVHWAAERVERGVVLDVGAQFGAWSVMLLRQKRELFCHAFEPNPEAASALDRMVIRNRLQGRLIVHRLALMDMIGQGVLHVPKDPQFSGLATMGHPIRSKAVDAIPVDMTTLDAWMGEYDPGPIELIKIDVEGAELFTLEGAARTIKRYHPPMILEEQAANLNQFQVKKGTVNKLVESWGYTWNRQGRDLFCE